MTEVENDRRFVRPYTRTGGRTRASVALELETVLCLVSQEAAQHLSSEHRAIRVLCARPLSVAEVAAHRALPIGAARVVLSDMIEAGLIRVLSAETAEGGPPVDVLQRVLEGLHRL